MEKWDLQCMLAPESKSCSFLTTMQVRRIDLFGTRLAVWSPVIKAVVATIECLRFHKIKRRAREKHEKKHLEQMAANDAEAYQDWVHKAEKQRIQVCVVGIRG